jgi:hypothetical protein
VFRLVGLSPRLFVSLALVGQVAVPLSSAVCAITCDAPLVRPAAATSCHDEADHGTPAAVRLADGAAGHGCTGPHETRDEANALTRTSRLDDTPFAMALPSEVASLQPAAAGPGGHARASVTTSPPLHSAPSVLRI